MTPKLSDELIEAREQAGDRPLCVENPRNHKRYLIVAEKCGLEVEDGEWSDSLNQRRFALIDKEIDGSISPIEAIELHRLQRKVDAYLERVAPLPIAAARELHDRLLRELDGRS